MIQARLQISGQINGRGSLSGGLNTSIKEIKPELENLTVTPSTEKQKFKSEKYGYDEVIVEKVTSDIDENIKSEIIREGYSILGVPGGYKGINTSDATATLSDILDGKTAYANNEKITGTIKRYDGSYSGNVSESVKITNASYLFYGGARTDYINELLELCKNITTMNYMFYGCSKLTSLDLSNLNTSSVTDMSYTFYNCKNLIELDLRSFNTNNVTTMYRMFSGCSKLTSLDLRSFNTSNVTDMYYMFDGCSELTSLDLSGFDTSNVTDMLGMFNGCSKLTSLDLSGFDTSNVTEMQTMFNVCSKLTSLDLSSFDMSKANSISNLFGYCRGLVKIHSFKNLGKGYTKTTNNYSSYRLDLSYSTNLTHESLIDIITNGLYDLNLTYNVANGGKLYTQEFVLGATNLSKLTAEEIAMATVKGWTVK